MHSIVMEKTNEPQRQKHTVGHVCSVNSQIAHSDQTLHSAQFEDEKFLYTDNEYSDMSLHRHDPMLSLPDAESIFSLPLCISIKPCVRQKGLFPLIRNSSPVDSVTPHKEHVKQFK